MSDPEYIVLRPAPDLPPGVVPADLDGKWFPRGELLTRPGATRLRLAGASGIFLAEATGRTEEDPEGQRTAEVFEVRP